MASPVTSTASVHPKRILVIGGGPTGLVALRNLTERGEFERVELVERRDDVGGVWSASPSSCSSGKTDLDNVVIGTWTAKIPPVIVKVVDLGGLPLPIPD